MTLSRVDSRMQAWAGENHHGDKLDYLSDSAKFLRDSCEFINNVGFNTIYKVQEEALHLIHAE